MITPPGSSHSTSQKATISSITIAPWSGRPSARPVRFAAAAPRTKVDAITIAQPASPSHGSSTTNTSHANSVPQVPGAGRMRPLPKPNDNWCAGCDIISRQEGGVGIHRIALA